MIGWNWQTWNAAHDTTYFNDDQSECIVIERYRDSEVATEHARSSPTYRRRSSASFLVYGELSVSRVELRAKADSEAQPSRSTSRCRTPGAGPVRLSLHLTPLPQDRPPQLLGHRPSGAVLSRPLHCWSRLHDHDPAPSTMTRRHARPGPGLVVQGDTTPGIGSRLWAERRQNRGRATVRLTASLGSTRGWRVCSQTRCSTARDRAMQRISRSKGTLRQMIRAGRVEALGSMARQPAGASSAPRTWSSGPRALRPPCRVGPSPRPRS